MDILTFEAACGEAIKEYHKADEDGPLLVSIRSNAKFTSGLGWGGFSEYAAAVGHWPEHHNGKDYAQYMIDPQDCIVDLVRHVQELHRQRQPETERDLPPEVLADRKKYDALLD